MDRDPDEKWLASCRHVLRQRCRNHGTAHDVEDAVQDAMLALLRADRTTAIRDPLAFCVRIAMRRLCDARRWRYRQRVAIAVVPLPPTTTAAVDDLIGLLCAMGLAPSAAQRELLTLIGSGIRSTKALARELARSPKTIRERRQRLQSWLRRILMTVSGQSPPPRATIHVEARVVTNPRPPARPEPWRSIMIGVLLCFSGVMLCLPATVPGDRPAAGASRPLASRCAAVLRAYPSLPAAGCTPLIQRHPDSSISFVGCPTWECGIHQACQVDQSDSDEIISCMCSDGGLSVLCKGVVQLDEGGLPVDWHCFKVNCVGACTKLAIPAAPGTYAICDC